MLGVILPVLSARWGLRDEAAGFLFFLQFLGSTLGAVFTGRNRMGALRTGYGLLAVGACALVFAGGSAARLAYFFYGLGLGLAMTATSLVASDRFGDDRAAKLERLNFVWSAGATTAPLLLIPFLRATGLRTLFLTFAGLSVCMLAWTILFEQQHASNTKLGNAFPRGDSAPLASLLPLVTLAMCSVGIEASLSGWLTTYSHRLTSVSLGFAAGTTALFWLGIVLSRFAFSTRLLTAVGQRRTLVALLWSTAAAVALLTAAQGVSLLGVAAGLAGLCVGPLYPLLLSFLLERTGRGWIFASGGIGSVIFPWLTGLLSTRLGSLRLGMMSPCAAAALMLLLLPLCFRSQKLRLKASGCGAAGLTAGHSGAKS